MCDNNAVQDVLQDVLQDEKEKDTFRVNIKIAKWINDWFDTKSKETGISKSALMAMALNEYIDQKETIRAMSRVDYFTNKLDYIKEYIDEKVGNV